MYEEPETVDGEVPGGIAPGREALYARVAAAREALYARVAAAENYDAALKAHKKALRDYEECVADYTARRFALVAADNRMEAAQRRLLKAASDLYRARQARSNQ